MSLPKKPTVIEPNEQLYLIDIPMAARRLSTTVFAVREIIRSGKLKYIPIGHKMLISPKAIENYIAESEIYYGEVVSRPLSRNDQKAA